MWRFLTGPGLPPTAADTAAQTNPPTELLWAAQLVTLCVGLAAGWFAMRGKRAELGDSRQARFEQRVDQELDDQRALNKELRQALTAEQRKVARYEALLARHGIDPDTGQRQHA